MVKCTCGRSIEKMPNWLAEVSVTFVCNNCPSRTVKLAQMPKPEIRKVEMDDLPDTEEEEDLDDL